MTGSIKRAAVIGTTAWGSTLAIQLARNGLPVALAARSAEEAARLEAAREHPERLPGVAFPPSLRVTTVEAAAEQADLVCLVVPSRSMTANLERLRPVIEDDATLLSATKGIEVETGRRMSELMAASLPDHPLAVLSGPNLSREVAAGLPSTTVIASTAAVGPLSDAFHSRTFRVYSSDDVVGVELGGALKNVVAIAGGMVDHFEFGNNTKAAILTRGLAEITRLAVAAGGDPLTLQGLAGVGDLMASAYSPLSRNRRLGELIGAGTPLATALDTIGETAEGANTVPAALRLAGQLGVDMPVASGLNSILYEGVTPAAAIEGLLSREPTSELR